MIPTTVPKSILPRDAPSRQKKLSIDKVNDTSNSKKGCQLAEASTDNTVTDENDDIKALFNKINSIAKTTTQENCLITLDDLLREKSRHVISMASIVPLPDNNNVKEEDEEIVQLTQCQSLKSLSDESLRHWVNLVKGDLDSILSGKKMSQRHNSFKMGGNESRYLTYQFTFGPYLVSQIMILLDELVKIYICTDTLKVDYILKVLLPEAMVIILSKVENIPYDTANIIMEG